MKLLKKHKNTYSDISAFDYNNKLAAFSLGWLLSLDENDKFRRLGNYNLKDKILWGSDYPMMLRDFKDYASFGKSVGRLIVCVI